MSVLEKRFSNAQLEVLKVLADDLPADDLLFLKKVLLRFKAERLMDKADQIWDEKGWTDEDVKRLLQIKMRTPYHQNQ